MAKLESVENQETAWPVNTLPAESRSTALKVNVSPAARVALAGCPAAGLHQRNRHNRGVPRRDRGGGSDGGRQERIVRLLDPHDVGTGGHVRDLIEAGRVAAARHGYVPRGRERVWIADEERHVRVGDGLALAAIAAGHGAPEGPRHSRVHRP